MKSDHIIFTPIDDDEFAADLAYLYGLADAMFEHVGPRLRCRDELTVLDRLLLECDSLLAIERAPSRRQTCEYDCACCGQRFEAGALLAEPWIICIGCLLSSGAAS